MQLFGRGREQLGGRLFHLAGGVRHPVGGALHLRHQRPEFFHGVVDRVGDGAGDVLGNGGLLRQVALGDRLQFVHQAKNGGLVGVVDALRFALARFRFRPLRFRSRRALALAGHE